MCVACSLYKYTLDSTCIHSSTAYVYVPSTRYRSDFGRVQSHQDRTHFQLDFATTMADTPEYKNLKKYMPQIVTALQTDLTTLSVQLVSKNLISEENASHLRNEHLNQNDRAADLISFVLNQVRLNPENYKAFISVLKESGSHFNDIIILLEQQVAYDQIPHAAAYDDQVIQQDSNISAAALSVQSSSTQTSPAPMQHGLQGVEPCTCRICTSLGGHPNHLSAKVKFPYLEPGGSQLDELSEQDLLYQLQSETESILLQFHEVVSQLYETVVDKNLPIGRLKFHLRAIKAFPTKRSSNTSIFKEYEDKIKTAKNYDDIFAIIDHFISFIDYRLLEHLVGILGSERDKERMKQYSEKFNKYAKRRIIECPAIEEGDSTKWSRLYIKLDSTFNNDEHSVTIQQLQKLRFKVSEILQISVSAIRFCCAQKGCIRVNWQIPCYIEQLIFPLSSKQLQVLKGLGVMQICCGNYQYKTQV